MTPAERTKKWRENNREKHRAYSREYHALHPEETKAKAKKWAKDNPEKRKVIYTKYNTDHCKERHLRNRYAITVERYNEIFEEQKGVCKICGTPPNGKDLVVDHDHMTGKVRGLLCFSCNFGLGEFKDDEIRLLSAVDYLRG